MATQTAQPQNLEFPNEAFRAHPTGRGDAAPVHVAAG